MEHVKNVMRVFELSTGKELWMEIYDNAWNINDFSWKGPALSFCLSIVILVNIQSDNVNLGESIEGKMDLDKPKIRKMNPIKCG